MGTDDTDIDTLLDEIDSLQNELRRRMFAAQYQRMLYVMIGIYTLYLFKIYYKNKGLYRPMTDIRATDILLILYASALI